MFSRLAELIDPARALPDELRAGFAARLDLLEWERASLLARAGLVVSLGLLVALDGLDVLHLPPALARVSLVVHVGMLLACAAFVWFAPREEVPISRRLELAAVGLRSGTIVFLYAVFVVLLVRTGDTTLHHLAVFSFALVFPRSGRRPLVFAGSAVAFLLLTRTLAPQSSADYYLSGVFASFLGYVTARHLLALYAREYLAQSTVTRQAEALALSNQQLETRNAELARLNSEKNEFLGIAAHDLKNPLNAIRGYAELLIEEPEIEVAERQDLLDKIRRAAERMFELVKNLLDVNAIEEGAVRLEPRPLDLNALVRDTAEGYRAQAVAKGQELELLGEPVRVLADAGALQQVADNLVSNAIKYSPAGKRIVVRVHGAGAGLGRFEVQDQGPGLTAEDRGRLFGKFARLSARPTAGEHSTGLGLSIAKHLIEAMGGHIGCESEPGQGACFYVSLPRAPA